MTTTHERLSGPLVAADRERSTAALSSAVALAAAPWLQGALSAPPIDLSVLPTDQNLAAYDRQTFRRSIDQHRGRATTSAGSGTPAFRMPTIMSLSSRSLPKAFVDWRPSDGAGMREN